MTAVRLKSKVMRQTTQERDLIKLAESCGTHPCTRLWAMLLKPAMAPKASYSLNGALGPDLHPVLVMQCLRLG